MEKFWCQLTDGQEIFKLKMMDEDEYRIARKVSIEQTAGNIVWEKLRINSGK